MAPPEDKKLSKAQNQLAEAFALFDKDGDETISSKELGAAMRAMGHDASDEQLDAMIKEVDDNHDGRIDFAEFLTLMKKKRPSSRGGSEKDDEDAAAEVRKVAAEAKNKARKRSEDWKRFSKANVHGVANDLVELPKKKLAEEPVDPGLAYQIIHDELMLEGNERLNLATFASTYADEYVKKLMEECAFKNMIDKDEYPRTAELEVRCVKILADLWNAPAAADAPGCSTVGSSEACMLAGLAMKRRWLKAQGADTLQGARGKPNIVMGTNVQVCWERFANYFEVEERLVPMEGERYHMDAESAVAKCDENTIGVITILGSTFDGSYEPVQAICEKLDELAEGGGPNIPVHVDGASGAMVAPFLDPELVWDFRLPRVASINMSGHKYGLCPPGVGWVVWRDKPSLPQELVYTVNYLGSPMSTIALNFSRPGAQVVAQYYQFLRLGREGLTAVQGHSRGVARHLADGVAALGPFVLLTDGAHLPVFAAALSANTSNFNVFDVSAGLRESGWQVPAYTFPSNRQDLAVLRFVVRAGFTYDLADALVDDLRRVVDRLSEQKESMRDAERDSAFSHSGK